MPPGKIPPGNNLKFQAERLFPRPLCEVLFILPLRPLLPSPPPSPFSFPHFIQALCPSTLSKHCTAVVHSPRNRLSARILGYVALLGRSTFARKLRQIETDDLNINHFSIRVDFAVVKMHFLRVPNFSASGEAILDTQR